jgi:hypothetical protein
MAAEIEKLKDTLEELQATLDAVEMLSDRRIPGKDLSRALADIGFDIERFELDEFDDYDE